jgi:hypothetical protein
MENINDIVNSIRCTTKSSVDHTNYPNSPGIYTFVLIENSMLKQFGTGEKIIYVGIAKDSLRKRDLNTHFRTGRTGHSTLRRSIGAILKQQLKLIALTRNGTTAQTSIDNYKFDTDGDQRLSDWMLDNLKIGYWEDQNKIPYGELRQLEKDLIKELKPTLDLDNRTRKFNPLASELDALRRICKKEAILNATNKFEK